MIRDQAERNAAIALFRLAHARAVRAEGLTGVRHMLHWLGVLLDSE